MGLLAHLVFLGATAFPTEFAALNIIRNVADNLEYCLRTYIFHNKKIHFRLRSLAKLTAETFNIRRF